MNFERIDLVVLANTNFKREHLRCPEPAPTARRQFRFHAQPAGIGTITDETQLQLFVCVAPIVSPKLQPICRTQDKVRIAVVIKIRGDHRINGP